jgi:hypothetical protein
MLDYGFYVQSRRSWFRANGAEKMARRGEEERLR